MASIHVADEVVAGGIAPAVIRLTTADVYDELIMESYVTGDGELDSTCVLDRDGFEWVLGPVNESWDRFNMLYRGSRMKVFDGPDGISYLRYCFSCGYIEDVPLEIVDHLLVLLANTRTEYLSFLDTEEESALLKLHATLAKNGYTGTNGFRGFPTNDDSQWWGLFSLFREEHTSHDEIWITYNGQRASITVDPRDTTKYIASTVDHSTFVVSPTIIFTDVGELLMWLNRIATEVDIMDAEEGEAVEAERLHSEMVGYAE
jgi:hypothetical protein|uniref:Uncharacterized protein n=1 Tax=viral metagenome TaxID=1070528 RepID=A0A6C0IU93_9ZZZZ